MCFAASLFLFEYTQKVLDFENTILDRDGKPQKGFQHIFFEAGKRFIP